MMNDTIPPETEGEGVERTVPAFIQIVTCAAHALGGGEMLSTEVLYGLDGTGRVWEWCIADLERKGAKDGWMLLPNTTYAEGDDPPAQRKTR